jgi:hypothetical protein
MSSLLIAMTLLGGCAAATPAPKDDTLSFSAVDGPGALRLVRESEFALRFAMDAAPAGLSEDCARSGTAMITADPTMDPEIDVSPEGEAYASRDFMFEDESPCMLSLRVELPPSRWLRLQEFRCKANDCTERAEWFLRAPAR